MQGAGPKVLVCEMHCTEGIDGHGTEDRFGKDLGKVSISLYEIQRRLSVEPLVKTCGSSVIS